MKLGFLEEITDLTKQDWSQLRITTQAVTCPLILYQISPQEKEWRETEPIGFFRVQ